ncbi:MAG: threonine synthase, partial [Oceanicaulis sp.]|nr:threonine synthase [Oceanicaulis sp.]
MRLISTRHGASASSISEAIRVGLAGDGGLFIPDEFPEGQLSGLTAQTSLTETALALFEPFFKGDALEGVLPELVEETYDFDVPLVNPFPGRPGVFALELFHGPTGAFKDVGARFLLRCLDRMGDPDNPFTVLAATSGDTGGAVGCAAEGRTGVRAVILYAKGRISGFQKRQLTCWNAPVTALEVEGDFDACQRMVKAAFADRALSEKHNLTSANSINIARLLPQAAYMAWAARQAYEKNGVKPGLITPTGNLGHGVAAIWARHMGAPW